MPSAADLLTRTQQLNRDTGAQRLLQQLSAATDSYQGQVQGFDPASGRTVVQALDGSIDLAQSLTTASPGAGRAVTVTGGHFDGVPYGG